MKCHWIEHSSLGSPCKNISLVLLLPFCSKLIEQEACRWDYLLMTFSSLTPSGGSRAHCDNLGCRPWRCLWMTAGQSGLGPHEKLCLWGGYSFLSGVWDLLCRNWSWPAGPGPWGQGSNRWGGWVAGLPVSTLALLCQSPYQSMACCQSQKPGGLALHL